MVLYIFNYFWQSYYNFKITNKNDIINYRLYSVNGLFQQSQHFLLIEMRQDC